MSLRLTTPNPHPSRMQSEFPRHPSPDGQQRRGPTLTCGVSHDPSITHNLQIRRALLRQLEPDRPLVALNQWASPHGVKRLTRGRHVRDYEASDLGRRLVDILL